MSIFGSIVSKIFGHAAAAPSSPGPSGASSGGAAPGVSSFNNPAAAQPAPGASVPQPQSSTTQPGSASPQPATPAPAPSNQPVDVAAVLDGLAAKNSQKLDWKHSIVDLMKLLGLDSSLTARQELAKELHYSGSTSDSAAMNIWLHKQVMQKLAENGGKVPDDLK